MAAARDFWDPKVHRRFWLDKGSAAIDAWLRSRAFLKLMQYGMRTAITVARLQDHKAPALLAAADKTRIRRLDSPASGKDLPS